MSTFQLVQLGGLYTSNNFPEPPSRDKIINGICRFQGVVVETRQYGTFRSFGPEINNLDLLEDRFNFYKAHQDAGTTILQIGYNNTTYSSGGFTFPVPGVNDKWSKDLPGFCDRLAEIIEYGFDATLIMLPGDADSPLFGYQWVMDNVHHLIDAMKNYHKADLTKYCLFVPGYDGVWYGWEDGDAVLDYGNYMRYLLPNGYLGIEFSAGVCHLGHEKQDYVKADGLSCFDVILMEFSYQIENNPNTNWQIGARLLGPDYKRYTQPDNEDPDSPFTGEDNARWYTSKQTPRGKYGIWAWEFDTFGWVRSAPIEQVNNHRELLKNHGWHVAG